jgi:hypothetical protein
LTGSCSWPNPFRERTAEVYRKGLPKSLPGVIAKIIAGEGLRSH